MDVINSKGEKFLVPGDIKPRPVEFDENGLPVCRDMECGIRPDCQVVIQKRVNLVEATPGLSMEGGVRAVKRGME